MTVPTTLPRPQRNLTENGRLAWASTVASADIIVASGDYTGGASEQLFTLTAHGLIDGDMVTCFWQSAMGAMLGGVLTRGWVDYVSSSTFHVCTDYTLATPIANTADGTVAFVKGKVPTYVIAEILPSLIVTDGDTTGGTAEDMFTPNSTGMAGLYEADTIKLLYKSTANAAGTLDTTYYAKAPTTTYFQYAATAGGNALATTADGTVIFLKTS